MTALGAATGSAAIAQTSHSPAAAANHQNNGVLNGSWATKVTLTDAPPGAPASFNALDTFVPGGDLLVTSSAPNPTSRGLAHGGWTHTHGPNFTSTFTWFRFDATGQYVGTQQVHRMLTVSPDGSTFHSTDLITVIAPTGAVLKTYHGTEVGTLLAS